MAHIKIKPNITVKKTSVVPSNPDITIPSLDIIKDSIGRNLSEPVVKSAIKLAERPAINPIEKPAISLAEKPANKGRNFIFIHVAKINNYQEVFNELLRRISDSGLYDNIKTIYVGCVGERTESLHISDDYSKIELLYDNLPINSYEHPTLNLIKDKVADDDNILYLHTKGVSHTDPVLKQNIKNWIDFMLFFLVTNWSSCLNKLETYYTCGCNLKTIPFLHYSGNFWWAKGKYVKTLCDVKRAPLYKNWERHRAEFWVCSNSKNCYNFITLGDCYANIDKNLYLNYFNENN